MAIRLPRINLSGVPRINLSGVPSINLSDVPSINLSDVPRIKLGTWRWWISARKKSILWCIVFLIVHSKQLAEEALLKCILESTK
jgi:hypothetical protein